MTGTALCAPTGPVAVLCGIAAGGATWLLVDKVAIEVDETLSRATLRAAILSALEEEKHHLIRALQQRLRVMVGHLAAGVQANLDGVFIPGRDGL